ncbi:ABC transporter permease [Halobellus sp. EA9]|uniref:ABC transporter permease n=1 Tax=Halobellus sp. EA9 TaxID=3421647 RepID=UPI003EB71DB4
MTPDSDGSDRAVGGDAPDRTADGGTDTLDRVDRAAAKTGGDLESENTSDYGGLPSLSLAADSPTLAVAGREYRLAVRSRWAAGIVLLFGLFTTAVVQFGTSTVGPGRFDAVLATVVELGVYLVPLVAVAVGYDVVVGAHERGSLELLLALPITRGRVIAGTLAGRAAVLSGAMLLGFVPAGVLTVLWFGPSGVGAYATVALAAALTGCAVLSVAVLVSTVAPTKTYALGGSLALWLWFVLLHDLAALGTVAAADLGGAAIAVAVLLNPVDCFRVIGLSQVDVVAGGFGAVMTQAGLSMPLAVAALGAWTLVPGAAAARLLRRRRL